MVKLKRDGMIAAGYPNPRNDERKVGCKVTAKSWSWSGTRNEVMKSEEEGAAGKESGWVDASSFE